MRYTRVLSRTNGALAFSVAGLCLIVIALLTVPTGAREGLGDEGSSDGYQFTNITTRQARDPRTDKVDPSTAEVSFDYLWATADYPGQRSCMVTVFDDDGRIVGSQEWPSFSGTTPGEGKGLVVDVPVHDSPSSTEILCTGPRRDASNRSEGNLVVSDVSARQAGRKSVTLTFDLDWEGPLGPSAHMCTAVVEDSSGAPIADGEFMVDLLSGHYENGNMDISSDGAIVKDIASVRLDCKPFSSEK